MLKKSAITAATIAAALVAFQPAANAGGKGHVTFSFSNGHSFGHGYGSDRGHSRKNFSSKRFQDERFLSRSKVFHSLNSLGYRDFHRTSRKGGFYNVNAKRNGKIFQLKIDARNGRIVRKRTIG